MDYKELVKWCTDKGTHDPQPKPEKHGLTMIMCQSCRTAHYEMTNPEEYDRFADLRMWMNIKQDFLNDRRFHKS